MNDMTREDLLALVTNRETVTRRDFVTGSLATGFALAVQPICAQTMIVTDTKGILAGEVRIPTKDGQIPAYVAMPDSSARCPTRRSCRISMPPSPGRAVSAWRMRASSRSPVSAGAGASRGFIQRTIRG